MKIIRRRDGVSGWAVQMVIPFTFGGWDYGPGCYIVEILNQRTAMPAPSFQSVYRQAWHD